MLPGLEAMGCGNLAVPAGVMAHVVAVESSFNPFAIGVVGARLQRQPRTLAEAVATAGALAAGGRNFSVGLAQVNRHNLARQGLHGWPAAFDTCANLLAGARILADCHARAQRDWPRAFSCYYSGNFETGFRHGYVDRVLASMARVDAGKGLSAAMVPPIPLVAAADRDIRLAPPPLPAVVQREARIRTRRAAASQPPSATEAPSTPPAPPATDTRDQAFVF